MLHFEIRRISDDQLLFVSTQTHAKFTARHRTFFRWDELDTVWVYSGDVGIFYWIYDETSKVWNLYSRVAEGVEVPDELKRAMDGD